MVKFTYENQGAETLLVYHLDEKEHLDSFAKGMLQGNEMVGIIRPTFFQMDLEQYLKYQVTSMIPLKDYLKEDIEKGTVLSLCFSVAEAIQEVEEYMLAKEKLVLNTEYIFVDITKKEASLLYLPVDEYSQENQEKEFLLYLLSHMRYRLDEDVSYVAEMIHFLNNPKSWEFKELQRHIKTLMEQDMTASSEQISADMPSSPSQAISFPTAAEVPRPQAVAEPEFMVVPKTVQELGTAGKTPMKEKKGLFGKKVKKSKKPSRQKGLFSPKMVVPGYPEVILDVDEEGKILPNQEPENDKKKGVFRLGKRKKPAPFSQQGPALAPAKPELPPIAPDPGAAAYMRSGSSDDNKTIILGGGSDCGATVLLGDSEPKEQLRQVVRLTRRRNDQSMTISEEVFHIGREGSFVNFYIGDNPAIGAVHADIFADEGQYYISDRNSVNHTYVNGTIVIAGQPQKLGSGDVITLANEDFDFIIS